MIRNAISLVVIVALVGVVAWVLFGCSATSPDGDLTLQGPVEMGLEVGEWLPGTDIQLVSIGDGAADFRIDGQQALKKQGDSLDWRGDLNSDVSLDLSLRLLWLSEDKVQTAGTVTLLVKEPSPTAVPVASPSPVKYVLPVQYSVSRGEQIPGTTLAYAGEDPERGAQFDGIEGYPYRKMADSLVWEGRLRDRVWIEMDLRVLFFGEKTAQLGGLATVWAEP